MDTNDLAKAKAARAIAEAQCAKAIEERDLANVHNNAMAAEIQKLRMVLRSIRVQAVVNGVEGHKIVVKQINEALGE